MTRRLARHGGALALGAIAVGAPALVLITTSAAEVPLARRT